MPNNFIFIVASECSAELEEKYNTWYNDVHVPTFMKYPGLKHASRFKLTADIPNAVKYLAIYEFETQADLDGFARSDAFKEAVADYDVVWKDGGFTTRWGAAYQLIKNWAKD